MGISVNLRQEEKEFRQASDLERFETFAKLFRQYEQIAQVRLIDELDLLPEYAELTYTRQRIEWFLREYNLSIRGVKELDQQVQHMVGTLPPTFLDNLRLEINDAFMLPIHDGWWWYDLSHTANH